LLVILIALGLGLALGERQLTLDLLDGEQWWAGVISQSHLMPLGKGRNYALDFVDDTAGNQGQPLLISSAGRYVWSGAPFAFRFDGKRLTATSRQPSIESGREGKSLRAVYRYVNQRFFPPAARLPIPFCSAVPWEGFPGTERSIRPGVSERIAWIFH
jgi:hypothetical protein